MLEIQGKDKFNEMINTNKRVFIDFFAPWCWPCQALTPTLESISSMNEFKDIVFIKVNVDENQDIAQELWIMWIPQMYLYIDWKMKVNMSWNRPIDAIIKMLREEK